MPFENGYFASQPKIGDLNGDGRADVAYFMNGSIRIAINGASGAPSFTDFIDVPFAYAEVPELLELADFNRDGKLDVVVTKSGANAVFLYLNATAPSSRTPAFAPFTLGVSGGVSALATGQLAGDAATDLLVGTPGNKLIDFVAQ